jgi:RimJ/RimL family protein N-acetyltransferase
MEFDRQPTLSDGVLALRPLAPSDWAALFAAAADPAIWALHPAHDRWQEPAFRRFFDEALAGGGALVVEEVATGAIIGSSRYDFGRAGPQEVEIGWTFLARAHWGGAANARLKRLMLSHALRFVPTVIFLVGESNWRSRRAMEKIGARLTDRIDTAEMAGQPVRHVVYAIDRGGFETGPLAPSAAGTSKAP